MTRIFIFGASSVYGVGGPTGGWADMIKLALHERMYGPNGSGEKYEIYNFGKPGATAAFVLATFAEQLERYGNNGNVVSIVSVGGNNSKAENSPENYVSTPEEYGNEMSSLLDALGAKSDLVVVVGNGFVDEAKTNPKLNPITGGKSYFTNKRRAEFIARLEKICREKGLAFIDAGTGEEEWKRDYLYADGLHPNQKGYELISKRVLVEIEKAL